MRPTIAIVGSVDPSRLAELELQAVDLAREACVALGRELAIQGCNIIVYSSDPAFVEGDIVRGYVASGKAVENSIQVRYPDGGGQTGRFPEMDRYEACFDPRQDVSASWEVSFYRSLFDTSGVLLIGGGRSTLITGLIAGIVCAALFVAAQLVTTAQALKLAGVRTLAILLLAIGFIAGLTTDYVFGKLRQQDVADVTALKSPA